MGFAREASSKDPPPASPPAAKTGRGVLAGLITAAVALGVGQLVAGITGPQGSPVVAVGGAVIDQAPPAVKDFAISAFGAHDKTVLVAGILVLLAGFSAVIGAAAVRRFGYGLAGLALFAAAGLAAALTRPAAGPADAVPVLAAAAAGAITMRLLVRAARPAPAIPPSPLHPGRRQFLGTSSAALVAAGASAVAGRLLAERATVAQARSVLRFPRPARPAPPLAPGTDLRIPGLSRFITPNSSFYRVDTALVLPEVPPQSWRLRIHGMVEREITLTFADLLRLPLIEDYITLTCVSNPVGGPYVGNAKWLGASVAALLRRARIRAGADQLLCTSVDGFTSGVPVRAVMDGRDALLAVAMNGTALPVAHGFPARMVVPGLYGYVSACKWITDINVTTFAAQRAYWAQRGWSQQAPIKTESRIDVPNGATALRPGRVPVAGVAWAQHKGIVAVEVRVDGGPWHQARLGAVPDIDTWRQWVWEWEATRGTHVIEARATDATGYTQTARQEPPEPNGATGYPAITVTV
jgi:DMSO/TMAO reductase YedYZ molybdopterin-dependent catalytic subunit